MEKITLRDAAQMAGGRLVGAQEGCITEIVRDNRQVVPGALFVALKGENHDGHAYVATALETGAVVALVEEGNPYLESVNLDEGQAMIVVEDTLAGLQELARSYRECHPVPVVAVTGSVGKTSCKDITAAALTGGRCVVKTQKNYNNQIGVPLTIFQMDEKTEAAVIEIGMNHKGEIDALARMAQPDYGIITNIGISHIENLGSQEGILQAKLEMVAHMNPQGVLYLNGDDPLLYGLKGTLPVKTEYFGFGEHNDGRVLETSLTESGRLRLRLQYRGEEYRFVLNTPGEHMAYNALPAIMIGKRMGITDNELVVGLTQYVPSDLRLQFKSNDKYRILDDSYNASPDSMRSALNTLIKIPGTTRRVVILGDMFELGTQEEGAHRLVGQMVAERENITVALFAGERARWMYEEAKNRKNLQCHWFPNVEDLEKNVFDIIQKDDIILVKASRGMAFDQVSAFILN